MPSPYSTKQSPYTKAWPFDSLLLESGEQMLLQDDSAITLTDGVLMFETGQAMTLEGGIQIST
jgi:hypothetical protein